MSSVRFWGMGVWGMGIWGSVASVSGGWGPVLLEFGALVSALSNGQGFLIVIAA